MAAIEVEIGLLRERLAPVGVDDLRRLTGGASSLSYVGRAAADRQRVVVKVAPAGVTPVLNRDVLRQVRMLRALRPTAVPVPEVLWEDAGDPPDVPPLFVMSFVEGSSLEPLYDRNLDLNFDRDRDRDDDATVVAERMRNAARTLADLHALGPSELSLDAEPSVSLAAEIDRWCRLLETVDPALVSEWEGVAAALRASEPPALPGAVVHGDFRLGNLLAVGSRVAAVVDWEIWSVGDPRVDVGWFLANADPETYRRATPFTGLLPTTTELAEIYAGARARDVPDLDWFHALACFKSTATWSLIVKHNRRRIAPDPALEEMAAILPHLLARARHLLA